MQQLESLLADPGRLEGLILQCQGPALARVLSQSPRHDSNETGGATEGEADQVRSCVTHSRQAVYRSRRLMSCPSACAWFLQLHGAPSRAILLLRRVSDQRQVQRDLNKSLAKENRRLAERNVRQLRPAFEAAARTLAALRQAVAAETPRHAAAAEQVQVVLFLHRTKDGSLVFSFRHLRSNERIMHAGNEKCLEPGKCSDPTSS